MHEMAQVDNAVASSSAESALRAWLRQTAITWTSLKISTADNLS
jgi:hypothetical protein